MSIGDTLLSGDGLNWTEASERAEDRDIIWSGTHFVSVGYRRASISSNGNHWSSSRLPTAVLNGVAYSGPDFFDGGRFVGVGWSTDDPNGVTVFGSDVYNLTEVTHGADVNTLYGVAWNGTRYVAVGGGGTVVHSTDGINWTGASESATSSTLLDVTWSGSRFVAVGAAGAIVYSSDGDSWTAATNSATSEWLQDVTWAGSQFVAVGAAGTIVHSSDGSSWKKVNNSGTANDLRGVAWNGARFVAVGLNGTIVVSP